MNYVLGRLTTVPASTRPDLIAEPTWRALEASPSIDQVGVVEIDPAISDTAATQAAFDLTPEALANCVIVGGKREGTERLAACVVPSSIRADVNGVVRRWLDVRKASFLPTDRATELTGMEYGGITPIGLPSGWPVLVDIRVIGTDLVVIGSGVRRSKLVLPGRLLGELPEAVALELS